MKIAIVGSRNCTVDDLGKYLPHYTTEIVSGGAKGIDSAAALYAQEHGIKLTLFLPKWNVYGRAAPLRRNEQLIEYSDEVIAFWDGCSAGTRFVIKTCEKTNKKLTVYEVRPSV